MDMPFLKYCLPLLCAILLAPLPSRGAEGPQEETGTILTVWPLIDYRESPREGFSNLGIFGPLIKIQRQGSDRDTAVRPLFYRSTDGKNETVATDYLYPLASTATSPDETSVQALRLYQKHIYHKDQAESREEGTMFFPFYISGTSKKYGPYTSVFPLYGDIYERFWRDEYHYVLFPLYGRTVNKGTTSTNVLYPIFNTVSGEKESGFHVWPLYGQAAKEGVYRRRFLLWPFLMEEEKGLDTDNPVHKRQFFPLYVASDSPRQTSRTYLWPFFGYRSDLDKKEEQRDYFWPFWMTVEGKERNISRYLPFYSEEKAKETVKRWYMWPLYRYDALDSDIFRQETDRVLYFLYSDRRESWPVDGKERRRTALWPLFVYDRDVRGVSSLSVPAPVEPILNREGIEKSWAPFWRLYQQRWNDSGDSAVSFLWNLYWQEVRADGAAWELYPFIFSRSDRQQAEWSFLKGLVRYRSGGGKKSLSFLWLPFGASWSGDATAKSRTEGEGEGDVHGNR